MKSLFPVLLAAGCLVLAGCPGDDAKSGNGKPGAGAARGAATGTLEKSTQAVAGLRDIEDAVQVAGFVEPVNAPFEVRSQVSGMISRIAVAVGDRVKRGQVLVEMDDTTPKADFEEASRNEQLAKLQLEKAERDHLRQQALVVEGFATERDALDAKTAFELAKLDLEVRRARLAKAKDNLSRTIIMAPYDGIISDLNVSQGQVVVGAGSVNSGTLLMKVNDFEQLQVAVKFNEFDAGKIAVGKTGEVTFDSKPGYRTSGTISYLSPFAQFDNNQRVFPAKVALAAKPPEGGRGAKIAPGVSANVRLITERAKGVVSVPVSAVFIEGAERFVYLKTGVDSFVRTAVKTGINDDGFIEIEEGVAAGAVVSLVRPARQN